MSGYSGSTMIHIYIFFSSWRCQLACFTYLPIWLLVGENRGGIGDNCPGIIVIFYCIAVSGDRALDLASDVCFCYSARFTANGLGMASLKDVARPAGVSMMTVSRVMHNAESVRPATRDRVLQAIQTLNYVPDLSARKMRAQGRKPSTLAVLAQDTATTRFLC